MQIVSENYECECTPDSGKLNLIKPTLAKDVKIIKASYNTWTEWKQDSVGYWLFRVNDEEKHIEAGFCTKGNVIEVLITGNDSEEMHNTIIREELVKSLQHAAYLGHELQKAEIALRLGLCYVQDKPLDLLNFEKVSEP
jgi:tetrahydromethanopterin S-methyltransferase subunit A